MMKPTTVAPRHPAGPVSARPGSSHAGVEIEFAQQMAAGNQRNGKQQQRDRQTDGLAVFAQPIQQAQALGLIGCSAVTVSCESDELARINHLLDCARQDGGIQPSYQSL
jgi:hypothetical protein